MAEVNTHGTIICRRESTEQEAVAKKKHKEGRKKD
jgi:hypothetical protein